MSKSQKSTTDAAAAVVIYLIGDAIVANLRSLGRHATTAAETFLKTPELWVNSSLTPAQKCGAFNLAMSAARVGLQMPTDSGGNKVWDDAVFARGMELAKGRTVEPQNWVSQRYSPVVIPGKDKRRSFWETIISLAERGRIKGLDPAVTFAVNTEGMDPKDADKARRKVRSDWLVSELKRLTFHKDDNPKGVLVSSRNYRLAVKADLKPETSTKRGANVSDEALLAELE